jgi:SPOR domain
MADSNFRSSRRDTAPRQPADDPLAELARLIGQSEARGARGRDGGQAADYPDGGTSLPELDWAATDDGYRRDDGQARESYGFDRPRDAGNGSWPAPDRADESYGEPSVAGRYSVPAAAFGDARADDSRQFAVSRAQPPTYVPPYEAGADADHAHFDMQGADEAEGQYEEAASAPQRRVAILALSVLGLAVLGTAGAFGYHAMFGGSMIPSLPPIIKPSDTPIKIVPKHESNAATANQNTADANGGTEKLVSHEEQPVNIQAANPNVPRVVTTIPVISDGIPPPGQPSASPQTSPPGVALPSPPAVPPPPDSAAQAPATTGPFAGLTTGESLSGSKPVHTVIIRPGQPAAHPKVAASAAATPAERVRRPMTRPVTARTTSAGPLSIVPGYDSRAAAPPQRRERTAMVQGATPMALTGSTEPAPARSGGYAVQISSRRSEADARAAFRSLQAKYPRQLGGRHEFIRRADLGAKGVYYRALVGPFASGQEAENLCSSLRAAGGSCLVQRN